MLGNMAGSTQETISGKSRKQKVLREILEESWVLLLL